MTGRRWVAAAAVPVLCLASLALAREAQAANETVNVWLTTTSDAGGRTVTRGLQQQSPTGVRGQQSGRDTHDHRQREHPLPDVRGRRRVDHRHHRVPVARRPDQRGHPRRGDAQAVPPHRRHRAVVRPQPDRRLRPVPARQRLARRHLLRPQRLRRQRIRHQRAAADRAGQAAQPGAAGQGRAVERAGLDEGQRPDGPDGLAAVRVLPDVRPVPGPATCRRYQAAGIPVDYVSVQNEPNCCQAGNPHGDELPRA